VPFTFLAHQAPVLPLKLAKPRWWSGTALVLGSMAPDLGYFATGHTDFEFGHTLAGQLLFCLPVTLALVWLLRRVIALPLAANVPDLAFFHLRDYGVLGDGAKPVFSVKEVASALVGSLSHVALDAFTHEHGWVVDRWPLLRTPVLEAGGASIPLYKLLQHGGTLAGGALALAMLAYAGQRRLLLAWSGRTEPVELPPAEPLRFWSPVAVGWLLGAAWGALELDGPVHSRLELAVRIFLRATFGLALGVAIAGALEARPSRSRAMS
jgi:hypothetical protein